MSIKLRNEAILKKEPFKVLNIYSPQTRVATEVVHTAKNARQERRTIQDMKDSCDLNHIFAKARKTGVIDHVRKYKPVFGEISGMDFEEAFNLVKNSTEQFQNLPATVRQKFNNSVENYLDFMSEAENRNVEALLTTSASRNNLATTETAQSGQSDAESSPSSEGATE